MSNSYEEGDILGDCAKCGEQASIKYQGGDKAYCTKCGVICEVEFDEDDRVKDNDTVGVPRYIRKSRPWRWAHELKRTGNPYSKGTKSWRVFDYIANNALTIPDIIRMVCSDERINTDGISYLITVHEVVTQGRYAGLLSVDGDVVSVCSKDERPQ
jgi:hypothetical protein